METAAETRRPTYNDNIILQQVTYVLLRSIRVHMWSRVHFNTSTTCPVDKHWQYWFLLSLVRLFDCFVKPPQYSGYMLIVSRVGVNVQLSYTSGKSFTEQSQGLDNMCVKKDRNLLHITEGLLCLRTGGMREKKQRKAESKKISSWFYFHYIVYTLCPNNSANFGALYSSKLLHCLVLPGASSSRSPACNSHQAVFGYYIDAPKL